MIRLALAALFSGFDRGADIGGGNADGSSPTLHEAPRVDWGRERSSAAVCSAAISEATAVERFIDLRVEV